MYFKNTFKMNAIVDNIYVINLDKRTDRLANFSEVMDYWDFKRHPAVNGSTDSRIFDKKLCNSFIMTNNEKACMLSHVQLWENLVNSDDNRILIFEDDATTHLDLTTIEKHVADLYKYLYCNAIEEPDMLFLGKALDKCLEYEKVYKNVYYTKHPLCLHAYIITKKAAKIFLDMRPYSRPIDVIPILASDKKYVKLMTFHPSLFFQDIFHVGSNLRPAAESINSTVECLVSMNHILDEDFNVLTVILVGLLFFLILFFIWFFR
jgi:GR25 family glycosyltransferase involved in LPS biosynthesis